MRSAPPQGEYSPYHAGYVALVADTPDIFATLAAQRTALARLADVIPAERETYRYAEGKWTLREVVGHLADAERIFGYRAVSISRGEKQPLPGFDENEYAATSPAAGRTLADLLGELLALRDANLAALGAVDDEAWTRTGTASNAPASTRGITYVIAGHVEHHLKVLRERYGLDV